MNRLQSRQVFNFAIKLRQINPIENALLTRVSPVLSLQSHNFSTFNRQNPWLTSQVHQLGNVRCVTSASSTSKSTAVPRWAKLASSLCGVIAFVIGYEYYKKSTAVKQEQKIEFKDPKPEDFLLKSPPPPFPPARSIVVPEDTSQLKLTLFQYQTCPFCCKTRAFLDYFGFSYDVVEVNSVTRKQSKWSKYKKVPILVAETKDGQVIQLNDSTMIISALTSYMMDKNDGLLPVAMCYPTNVYYDVDEDGDKKSKIDNKYFLMFKDVDVTKKKPELAIERKWRKWVDDVLVHDLSPNVYRTFAEALQAFKWFDTVGEWEKHFNVFERYLVIYVGALAMYFIGKRLKKRHRLKEDVRQSLYDDCEIWMAELKKKKTPFLGGHQPNLADLAVFGCLSAIEGCDTFKDLEQNSSIVNWFYKMKEAVARHEGVTRFA